MSQIYKVRLFLALNGASANNHVTNDWAIKTDLARGNAGFRNLADAIAAAFRPIVCTPVTISRILFTPDNGPDAAPAGRGNQMNRYINLAGTHATATASHVALHQIVALFGKSAGYGNPGVQKIRGCVFDDEKTTDGSGALVTQSPFSATPFNAFGAAFIAAHTNNAATLVLPPAANDAWGTGHRTVTDMTYAGLGLYQLDKSTKSRIEKVDDVIDSTIKDIVRAYNRASRDAHGNTISIATAILNALVADMARLVAQYGMAEIVRRSLPPVARTLLALLP